MANPFEPITIAGMEIRNRFQRSATWDASATDDGEVTDTSVKIIGGLARGGVGLIVTGYAYVSDEGKAAPRQYGISHDRHIEGLRRLVNVAHDHGARIASQIAHGGINSRLLVREGGPGPGPSQVEGHPWEHRAMTADEIEATVRDFAAAAVRAKEAGFDAVQLHAAHGYLMNQFLSPLTNLRTDEWGGSPEKRRRFHVEVLRAVRQAVGDDYPVLMKIGLRDRTEGGMTPDEGLEALRTLASDGLSAVEISTGIGIGSTQTARLEDPERVYFREDAAAAKRALAIPVSLVGGIRAFPTVESILDADADMVSLCRPLIRENDLIARWQRGDRAPAKCLSCNKCFGFGVRGEPLECGEEFRLRQEAKGGVAEK
jgi:2,4-dienoyl-CoA reductase-like NADH-dependent reductase (Old Yellow Enzyme family)